MRAPVLAVGDGTLGFWNALREIFPESREGRCWFHNTANVLAALPKSAYPGAEKALAEICGAGDKPHALAAVKAFEAAYGAKFPKATAKITDDMGECTSPRACRSDLHQWKLIERPGGNAEPRMGPGEVGEAEELKRAVRDEQPGPGRS
jgi:transposase-like protein